MKNRWIESAPRRTMAFILLLCATLLGAHFSVPVITGGYFLFASIPILAALRLFAVGIALCFATVGALVMASNGHTLPIPLLFGEVLAVAWLSRLRLIRSLDERDVILSDTLFWLLVGIPLACILSGPDLPLSLKFGVNGILNALLAGLLLNLPAVRRLPNKEQAEPSLRQILFLLILLCTLLPALLYTLLEARREISALASDALRDVRREASQILYELHEESARSEPQALLRALAKKHSHKGRYRITFLDGDGRLLAPVGVPEGSEATGQGALLSSAFASAPSPGPEPVRTHPTLEMPLGILPGTLRIQHSDASLDGSVHTIYLQGFSLSLAFALIAVIISLEASRRLSAPLRRLSEATLHFPDRLARGESIILPDGGFREIVQLTHNLRTTAHTLQKSFAEVHLANDELGRRVAERTKELERINQQLHAENAERRRAEAQLHLSHQIIQDTQEGVMVTDPAGRIEFINPAFCEVTGYSAQEVIGKTPSLLKSGLQGEEYYRSLWQALLETGRWEGEISNRRKNGEVYSEWLTINALHDDKGNVTHYVGIFSDITAQVEIKERLHYLAYHDGLTGLPNRELFSDRLHQALLKAQRKRHRFAVLCLDLDRFKVINDTLGHNVGDTLIQEVAKRLGACVRDSDTLARQGGDEFTLLIESIEDEQEAALDAQRLVEIMSEPFHVAGNEFFVTTSIGISLYPIDGRDEETLIRSADIAMYRAKERGGNSYQFFTPSINAASEEWLTLETGLRWALPRGELHLCYQPQVHLPTGNVIGVEALLRWEHPELGRVSPAKFISIAEETGLIGPIGEWVLETACQQSRQWQEQGFPAIRIAVNVSLRQFRQQDFAATVRRTLERARLDPRYLELELTESIFIDDAVTSHATLDELKAIGVRLSIDDFGTGYSSLSYLKRLPIDSLKIDQSFVKDVPADLENASIINAIIAMAQGLQVGVIAEGVETEAQLAFLRSAGCTQAQGYLFGKPCSAHEAVHYLHQSVRRTPPYAASH